MMVQNRLEHEFAGSSRFEVLSCLGKGGMGAVYEALDRERGIRVALKTLPLAAMSAERLLLFKREFRALQDLQHPNLVQLGELFEEGGQWFFTMELVDGIDFLAYVNQAQVDADAHPGEEEEPATSALLLPEREGEPDSAPAAAAFPAAIPTATVHYDERRLRSSLIQLAQALAALHSAKKVHRDLKPSTVTPDWSARLSFRSGAKCA